VFTEAQKNKVIETWGRSVCLKILREIDLYSEKWRLYDITFFEHYSMNAIFYCKSALYGDCALKISGGYQNAEFVSEYNVLREYNGRRFARVLASDIDLEAGKKAMLIERVFPGNRLKDEKSPEKRLAAFSELFNGMHIKPENPALYIKYEDKLTGSANYARGRKGCEDLYAHIMKARGVYADISAVYRDEALLHGDLNCNNILLKDNGKYIAVDPQGLVGAYVFDIPRYILIEFYSSPDISAEKHAGRINGIIEYLESSLNVPGKIIGQCFYVETVIYESWSATVNTYSIDNIIFAEMIMKKLTYSPANDIFREQSG